VSIAAMMTAASSLGSRALISTIPSSRSATVTRRSICCPIRRPSADRNAEIIVANWAAVAVNASSHSLASSTTSTTRVTSRTLE
jgi:hypothetical protein